MTPPARATAGISVLCRTCRVLKAEATQRESDIANTSQPHAQLRLVEEDPPSQPTTYSAATPLHGT